MIGNCVQHNLFLVTLRDAFACCSDCLYLSWPPQDSAAMLAHLSHTGAALQMPPFRLLSHWFSLCTWNCRNVSGPVRKVQCAFVLYIHELKGCASALKIKTINQFHHCEPKLACPCGYAVCAVSFCMFAACSITHLCLSPIEARQPLHRSERPRCDNPRFPSTCMIMSVKIALIPVFACARTS